MDRFIAGIDEAGRGPIIGPLVIVVAAIEKSKENILKDLGVKDSKLLTQKRREEILEQLKKHVQYEICLIEPSEIDDAVNHESYNLNWLEADKGAKLLDKIDARLSGMISRAYIDCPSNNTEAYKKYFGDKMRRKMDLVVEHKADYNYLIVGAASIIAKVMREMELKKSRKKFGVDFGSGYPADPKTKEFVKKYHNEKKYSSLFRKSWSTYKDARIKQASLDQY